MSALSYLKNNPDQVLEALRLGEITAIEVATEQVPDFFMLYAIESGLLDELAQSFPDPRVQQPEIPIRVLLAAGIAGHFAGLFALTQLPYALHSPRLLAMLGVQVCVNQPGMGLSRKGTKGETPFHGDVIRKLLEQIGELDKDAKRIPGQSLIDWYNSFVGAIFCLAINAEPMIHILDCTHVTVTLKNDRYELSGITSRSEGKAKTSERGYKLGTIRSLLDEGAVITAITWGQIQENDVALTKELVCKCPHLKPGDIVLEDRGFLDGPTITYLKKERQLDVYTGLKNDMHIYHGAVGLARTNPKGWEPHPTRKDQEIQLIKDQGFLWETLDVPVNVCVVRWKEEETSEWSYFCFVTTDLTVSARLIIQTYQARTEIEEGYRQLKSSSWQVEKFCTTRHVQIVFHVLLTLIAYNLFQIYANTKTGSAFAGMTKQKIEREHRRNQEAFLLICTPQAFGVFKFEDILYITLDLPDEVRQKIRALLKQKRE